MKGVSGPRPVARTEFIASSGAEIWPWKGNGVVCLNPTTAVSLGQQDPTD